MKLSKPSKKLFLGKTAAKLKPNIPKNSLISRFQESELKRCVSDFLFRKFNLLNKKINLHIKRNSFI